MGTSQGGIEDYYLYILKFLLTHRKNNVTNYVFDLIKDQKIFNFFFCF